MVQNSVYNCFLLLDASAMVQNIVKNTCIPQYIPPSTQGSEIFPMWTVSQLPETLHAGTLTPTGSIVNSLTVFQFFSNRIRSTWDFWEWFFALYFSSYQECYIQRKIISINEKSRKQATSNISSYRLICKVSWKVLKLGTNDLHLITNKMPGNDFL